MTGALHGLVTGVVTGVVEDLDDSMARVRVRISHLDQVSDWLPLVLPMAGNGHGVFFRPGKGDQVVLACEHGDPRSMYVLGSVWSAADQPPGGMGEPADNAIRAVVSRSGHRVELDDTSGSERVRVVHRSGRQSIVLDGSTITVHADAGAVDVTASGDVTVSAGGDLTLRASKTVTISGTAVKIN